jgi:hypothetical protein
MKILLGAFNAKAGQKNIFKPTVESENLHPKINDNSIFTSSSQICLCFTMWYHTQIDNILLSTRRQSSIIDNCSLRRRQLGF